MTAPATTPALDGSSKASAEGMEGWKNGWRKRKKGQELMAVFKEALLSFGGCVHRSSCIVSVL